MLAQPDRVRPERAQSMSRRAPAVRNRISA
jgi:hypothetical protein